MTINPLSIEKYLDQLERKYEGKDLHRRVRGFIAAHFSNYYFKKHNKVRGIDIYQFKKMYEVRLKNFWKRGCFNGAISKSECKS